MRKGFGNRLSLCAQVWTFTSGRGADDCCCQHGCWPRHFPQEETHHGYDHQHQRRRTDCLRHLSANQAAAGKSLERLSSGFRINKAADDAAGLVISEKLQSQTDGIKVAVRNAQDGIGIAQTADGALTETTSMLHRMRDLAMHASNGGTDADGVAADQAEADQLASEIDCIADTTKFGSTKLLDGSFDKNMNVGASDAGSDLVKVTIESGTAGEGFSSNNLGVQGPAAGQALVLTGATAVADIDKAIDGSPSPVASSVRSRTVWSTPSAT